MRCLAFTVRAMESTKLTNQIVVANVEETSLAFKLYVLWFATENYVFKDAISVTDSRKPLDNRMRTNLSVVANFDVVLDYDKRCYSDVFADCGIWADGCAWMNVHKKEEDDTTCPRKRSVAYSLGLKRSGTPGMRAQRLI